MFVPLHVHSQFSILDASPSVKELAKKAKAFGMPALALTDHGNLYGAVEFYKACKEVGVKPILGLEAYVAPHSRFEKKKERGERSAFHLTLLAKNQEGYRNLCKLTSLAFLEGFYYHPRIDHTLLEAHCEGLICLSGCMSSRLSYEALEGTEEGFYTLIDWYLKLFGEDFYLEIQRHPMSEIHLQEDGLYQESWLFQHYQDYIKRQNKLNEKLLEAARKKGIPCVATNDSHYIERSDWRAHEVLINVQSGEPCEIWEKDSLGNPKFRVPNPKRRTYPSHECYFKSPQEMQILFNDIPEAISNTLKIAEKCSLELDFNSKHYPVYFPPGFQKDALTDAVQKEAVADFLQKLCEEGILKRYTPERLAKVQEAYPERDPMEVIRNRIELEMSVIVPKGMADYLLIVWDFIHWAKQNGIPVGPGRGSGAGSIVLYLIGVTDIEPLRFHLFFERFINPERISYPDIDVDICMDQRERVIQYTLDKYGKDNVAQIITFGTMKAKMAIRDVGRVLSVPLPKVNEIAKLVPDDLNITLEEALEKDPDLRQLYEKDEETRRVIDLGKILEGSIRNTGIHAAGLIISGEPLTEYIPVCVAKDAEMPVTQYSMKPVEMVGMLKVDFLGLKTLTAIQVCVKAIQALYGKEIDWIDLPLDDEPTFKLLNQGKTMGIFQLESGGMQDLARQLHLDKFEEIIAVGALYRPGPMDMIPSFIARKHGREPIEYDHPWMQEILAETYGIMVYQEQVMQIAQKLANYSLGEGDVLRRAMGKKDREQMAKEREKFRSGALANSISEEISMAVFDKMEKFAEYGFNKSHAAAYGYISYVTAYLKANYPKEWMAALMTCDSHDISKVAKFIRECQSMQIAILSPDVNEAGSAFAATSKGIRFAMGGIKGIGTGVVEAIIEERNRKGPYKSLYDFVKRLTKGEGAFEKNKVGKKAIEGLVEAGCFDFTGWSRDQLRVSIEPMFETAAKENKEQSRGVISFFDRIGESSERLFAPPPEVKQASSSYQMLLKEKELLGFFLTGHPMDGYASLLKRFSCIPLRRVEELGHDALFRSAFIVESVRILFSAKSQRKFAILMISDGIESLEMPVWPDLYEEKQSLIRENQLLYAILQVDRSEGNLRLSCRFLDALTEANEAAALACDQAYERIKHQTERVAYARKKGVKKGNDAKKKGAEEKKLEREDAGQKDLSQNDLGNENPKRESFETSGLDKGRSMVQETSEKKEREKQGDNVPKKLYLTLDAEKTRLSHVLALKQLFADHRGDMPVEIRFIEEERHLAALHIDLPWGVNTSSTEFQEQLAAILRTVRKCNFGLCETKPN